MRKHLLPTVMLIAATAVATQAKESAKYHDFLGDTVMSHLRKAEFCITDAQQRKQPARLAAATRNIGDSGRSLSPREVTAHQAGDRNIRLDSIVGYDNYGDLYARQTFRYNDVGKLVSRLNSFYNAASGEWEAVEEYGYEWNEKGNIVSEYCIGYGSGMRYDYTYDNRDLGVEKVTYVYESETWMPVEKGEYAYDDNGNMIKETLFFRNGSDWQEYARNTAGWDSLHRQTSIESYQWNGTGWYGIAKEKYAYFGDTSDQLVRLERWWWNDAEGLFQTADIVSQEFNESGQLTYQGRVFWNADKEDWSGNYPSFGTDICTNVYSDLAYDDRGRIVSDVTYYDYAGEGDYFKSGGMYYRYGALENGDYDMWMESHLWSWPDNTETIDQKRYARYDSSGRNLWMVQQVLPRGGTELINDYEEKFRYDANGNLTQSLHWSWDGNYRIPELRLDESYDSSSNIQEQHSYYREDGYELYCESLVGVPEITETDMEGWSDATKFSYGYENGVRVDKFGWIWSGSEWLANFGNDVVYDFDIPASRLIVPDGWADPYKVESATTYSGDGGTEFIKNVNRYFYTDLSSDGVGAVREEEGLTYDGRTVSVMDSSARISVYDLEGRLVAEGESSVDTGRLSRGVYVAEAVVSGRHAVMKIVVR